MRIRLSAIFIARRLNTTFNAQITQHLLQGFGWAVNGRYIAITKNNRRITDSSFRAQLLYTIDQIENIYWGLVGAYEDERAKEGALKQSTQLLSDDQKQLQIGTLAPLDVMSANAQVASDKQALITAKTKLEYQQLIIKQAIARNLDDPIFAAAPVIPTDRVSLMETPEEEKPLQELVQDAYTNSPNVEQALLALKNQEITLKSVKNGLLPVLDVYAFYGAQAIGGAKNPLISCGAPLMVSIHARGPREIRFPTGPSWAIWVNSTGSNKGVGFNFTVPIRNRHAQAQADRAQLEYRQSQMRLQQLYVQLKMQVTNQIYALQNDRAQVQSAEASQDYAVQSLDAEQKKYRLGASTSANVLSQTRNLETAQDNLISAQTDVCGGSCDVVGIGRRYLAEIWHQHHRCSHRKRLPGTQCSGPGSAPSGSQTGATPSQPGSEWQRYRSPRQCDSRSAGFVELLRLEK